MTLNTNWTETNGQSVEHVNFSSVAKCRRETAAIFRGIVRIFRGISKLLFIYLFHDFSRNPWW